MNDVNGSAIEYGDGVIDVRHGTRGYAREQNGDCLVILDNVGLTRVPLCYVMVIWKPLNSPNLEHKFKSDKLIVSLDKIPMPKPHKWRRRLVKYGTKERTGKR